MAVRITAGETFRLEAYLDRFGDLLADPDVRRELFAAESDLRRRVMAAAREESAGAVEEAGGAARPPVRIGRYELGDVIGRGAFGVVHRAWDTTLQSRRGAEAAPSRRCSRHRGPSSGSSARPAARPACGIRTSSRSSTPARSTASPTWSAP